MPGFFESPQIPYQAYPEPPGFGILRYMQMMNMFRNQSNPWGFTPQASGPSALNPYAGRGLFDPYGGGYMPSTASGANAFYNPGVFGGFGFGGFGGGRFGGFGPRNRNPLLARSPSGGMPTRGRTDTMDTGTTDQMLKGDDMLKGDEMDKGPEPEPPDGHPGMQHRGGIASAGPRRPGPGEGYTDLSFDGQTGVTNPNPYPHEWSPQPYDGDSEDQRPTRFHPFTGDTSQSDVHAGESISDMAKRHLELIKLERDFMMPLLAAEAMKANATPSAPTPSPTPAGPEALPLILQKAGTNPQKSIEAADAITNQDGDAAPPNELGVTGQQHGYDGAMPKMPRPPSGHVRAPLSMPTASLAPKPPMKAAAGLARMLSGLSGANRRGQIASYRVGRPGVVYGGGTAWKTGSPPVGSKFAPPTVPKAAVGMGRPAYDAVTGAQEWWQNQTQPPGSTGSPDPMATGQPPARPTPTTTGGPPPRSPMQGGPGGPTGPGEENLGKPGQGDPGLPPGQDFPTGAQNLGAPMSPWLMPYQGQFTAPMSPFEQGALGGMSGFVGSGMGMAPAYQYANDVLSGKYIGSGNPYMADIQKGAQTLKDFQDQQAMKRIGSSMAAGGNALSGARMSTEQQYQNLSDANFQQMMGNMQLQNLARERGLQQGAASMPGQFANTMMGGYGSLMNYGALPRQLQQQDLASQYGDWLRQTQGLQGENRYQNALQYQMLHSGYPGFGAPQYGQSTAAGVGGLLAGLFGKGSPFGDLLGNLFKPKQSEQKPGGGAAGGGGPSGGGGGGSQPGKPGAPGEPGGGATPDNSPIGDTGPNGEPIRTDDSGQEYYVDANGNQVYGFTDENGAFTSWDDYGYQGGFDPNDPSNWGPGPEGDNGGGYGGGDYGGEYTGDYGGGE